MTRLIPLLSLILLLGGSGAYAQEYGNQGLSGDVDLILPPGLESKDAPFYRGARVKIGDTMMPVTEAPLANGKLAEFQPEQNRVVVSNAATASEEDKGSALLDVVVGLQAGTIATAAGQ
ncbi:MAG: hypothetical protein JWM96_1319 [Alphaproteobacteria bacterium]|nr:hypothetical protein [Alphaproteobacteria bacterium]